MTESKNAALKRAVETSKSAAEGIADLCKWLKELEAEVPPERSINTASELQAKIRKLQVSQSFLSA